MSLPQKYRIPITGNTGPHICTNLVHLLKKERTHRNMLIASLIAGGLLIAIIAGFAKVENSTY